MEEKKIVSLCMSAIRPVNGNPIFFRIADLSENGIFVPFKKDAVLHGEEYNIEVLIRPAFHYRFDFPAEGTLALIEWSSYFDEEVQKYHQSADFYDGESTWIEYIRLNGVANIEQLKAALLSGVDINFEKDMGYLIEISKMGSDEFLCAYCDTSVFISKPDGMTVLDERIYELDTFIINEAEIAFIQVRFITGLMRHYYTKLVLPEKMGTVLIRNPSDMVKNVIIKRINRCAGGLDKSKRQVLREFLRVFDSDSILESIIAELRCSEEKAQDFLDSFIVHCENYLSDEDFLRDVLLDVVGNDNNVARKYKMELKEEFEREFEAEKQKSYDELNRLDSESVSASTALEEILARKLALEESLATLQKEYDEQMQLVGRVEELMCAKIVAARNNLADFLAEYAMFAPLSNVQTTSAVVGINSGSFSVGQMLSDDFDSIRLDEAVDYLSDNLIKVGVDSKKSRILAAYLLSAFSLNVPLIVAGYGATALVDAISATIYNRTADKIFVDGKAPPSLEISGRIVSVYDAFGCMDKVLEVTRGKYVCFISQTSEELAIEPRSLYNYALPIFLEYFIKEDAASDDEVLGSILEDDFKPKKEIGNKMKTMLPSYCLPRLAQNRVKALLDLAQDLYGGSYNINDIFMMQVIPIMLACSLKTQLIELITQKYTNAAGILRLMGEPDEYSAD